MKRQAKKPLKPRVRIAYMKDALVREDYGLNNFSAFCHFTTIIYAGLSMIGPTWLEFDGDVCIAYISLEEFVWDESLYQIPHHDDYHCLRPELVYSMNLIILFCYCLIISSLLGLFMDMIKCSDPVWNLIKEAAYFKFWSIGYTVLISGTIWNIWIQADRYIGYKDKESNFDVSLGLGFCLAALAGWMQVISLFYEKLRRSCEINDASDYFIDVFNYLNTFPFPTPPKGYS